MENPYLDEFQRLYHLADDEVYRVNDLAFYTLLQWRMANEEDFTDTWLGRHRLIGRYAWAVPDERAIRTIAARQPLIEIGAGRGYWAWCLRQIGADILAFDQVLPPDGDPEQAPFTEVLPGGPECLSAHPDRTLFLCWPPPMNPMAADCLKQYAGSELLYVGDLEILTGDDEFRQIVREQWQLVEEIPIPQFEGVHDRLIVFRRNKLAVKARMLHR